MDRQTFAASAFALFLIGLAGAWLLTPLGQWLSLDNLAHSRDQLASLVAARPWLCAAGFFLLCIAATAACFPAAPLIGVTGGALFGFWPGLAIVLVASAAGSTIAFLNARSTLRGWAERRFAPQLQAIDRGVEANGPLYLLSLRFNPVVPYWLVNLAMGLTGMRPAAYVPLTLIGLAPATFVYVTAGTQLATLGSAAQIVSLSVAAGLLLVSLLPVAARGLVVAFTAPLPDPA